MTKVISSTELQRKTREVIDWTRTKGEAVVVETYGKPMAVIISFDEYQAYLNYQQTQRQRPTRSQQSFEENEAFPHLKETEIQTLIKQTKQSLTKRNRRIK